MLRAADGRGRMNRPDAILLGTGAGKADPNRFSPSNVVWLGEEPVLVDCGNGALLRLREAGIYPGDIRRLFLTHLHYDHYADYPYLMIEPLIGEAAFGRGRLQVYGPPGTERLVRSFEQTYDAEIDTYAYLAGYERTRELCRAEVIETYDGWSIELEGWQITTAQVDHGVVKIPSFAYRFRSPDGKVLVFSGDTVPCDGIVQLARGADVLVYESTLPEQEVELRKQHGFAWYIHSTPRHAGLVARDAGVGSLVLNHFAAWNSFVATRDVYDWEELAPPSVRAEYDGKLIVGHDLLEIDL
jgi:ribonuclease Z